MVSFAAFEALAVSTVLPATVKDLGGLNLYGWVFSAFLLTNLIGIVASGEAIDRSGLARPLVAGIALFVLGLLCAGSAPSMPLLVLSRAVQGLGAGFLSSLAYVCIAQGYPESAKARMLAVLSSAWVVPGLVGPALAGAIADHLGWRWVFWGLAPLPLFAALLAYPALAGMTSAPAPREASRRLLTALGLAVGTGLLLAAGTSKTWGVSVLLALPGLALAVPTLRRLMPAQASGSLSAAIATTGLLNLTFFGVDAFVPLLLTGVRGQSLTKTGLVLTAATLTWTTGAWVQAHLAARQARRAVAVTGLLLIALAILGLASVLSAAVPVWMAAVAWGVAGLGMGLAYSTTKLVGLETMPQEQAGATAASMQLADVLGAAVGAGLGGALVAHAAGGSDRLRTGLLLVDLTMLLLLILAIGIASRLPGRPS